MNIYSTLCVLQNAGSSVPTTCIQYMGGASYRECDSLLYGGCA